MSDVQRRHEAYMREALVLAEEAAEHGDVPVGCVVVVNDRIVGSGSNAVQRFNDPTLHAEIVAIRNGVEYVGEKFLDGATLYVTLEPCAMCAGAIVMARVNTVVYGAAEPKTGAARSVFELLDDPRTNHQCVVRSGILEQESSALLTAFFEQQRRRDGASTTKEQEHLQNEPLERVPLNERVGTLYLVPTPIGNLGDITKRALEMIRDASAVYCEDTRHTGLLLKHYGIVARQLVSNHEHNERHRAGEIVERLKRGENIVLVSDAGMPGISDPGYRAVTACILAGLPVSAIPGASAAVTALAASGLATNSWFFAGFPPQKKGRLTFVTALVCREETSVLYESPHRIEKLLSELLEAAGPDRRVVVARELTKLHEEYLRGTLQEVRTLIAERGGIKGECVVILDGAPA